MIFPPVDHLTWVSGFLPTAQLVATLLPAPQSLPVDPSPSAVVVAVAAGGRITVELTTQGQSSPIDMAAVISNGAFLLIPQILINEVSPPDLDAGFLLTFSKTMTFDAIGLTLETVQYQGGVIPTLGSTWTDEGSTITATVAPTPEGSQITVQADIILRATGTATAGGFLRRIIDFPLPTGG